MTEKFYKLPVEIAARKDLTPGSRIFLAVVVDRIGHNGVCWWGLRGLARDAGLNVSTAERCK